FRSQFQSSLQPEQGRNSSAGLRIEMHNLHSGGAMWQSTKALPVEPMTSYLFQSYYRSDVNTSIVAEITLKDGSKVFQNLGKSSPSQAWKLQSYTFVAPRSAIKATVYQVLNTDCYVVTDDYYLGRSQPRPLPIGMISPTCDDGAEQIYTNALPLLDKYNINSTQYVLTQPIPNKHSGYYINSEQLLAFTASGHELGSHTSTHLNLAEVDPNQSESEMVHAQKELYELTGNTVLNFATPYGSYDQRVIEQSRQYYCSHRSTDLGFNSPDYFDLYNIKVKNVTVDTPVEEIYAWIDYAEKNRVWLVIVLHEIGYDNGHYS